MLGNQYEVLPFMTDDAWPCVWWLDGARGDHPIHIQGIYEKSTTGRVTKRNKITPVVKNITVFWTITICDEVQTSTNRSHFNYLTHWGRVTHICVSNLTIIGSDNGLSPGRHQAIIWTNAGILLIGPLGTNFCEILIGIQTFPFTKMHLKMSSAKWIIFCPDLNILIHIYVSVINTRKTMRGMPFQS